MSYTQQINYIQTKYVQQTGQTTQQSNYQKIKDQYGPKVMICPPMTECNLTPAICPPRGGYIQAQGQKGQQVEYNPQQGGCQPGTIMGKVTTQQGQYGSSSSTSTSSTTYTPYTKTTVTYTTKQPEKLL